MTLSRWSPQPIAGISAQRVVLRGAIPDDGVRYIAAAAGDSPFTAGEILLPGTVLDRPVPAWFHPQTGPEPQHLLDLEIPIVAETPDLLVVDKPHGLPSTPNGPLMRATAQTLLRVRRDEPELTAAHRLDRLTGGLLLLVRRPQARGFYQSQFQNHTIRKTYEATTSVAHVDAALSHAVLGAEGAGAAPEPRGVEEGAMGVDAGLLASGSREKVELWMRKEKGDPHVRVVGAGQGGKRTVTWVTRTGERTFRLEPLTGHTHQLRVLMNHLGLPIAGDDTYPNYAPNDVWNPDTEKLQLRAVQLELELPEGIRRTFRTPSGS